MLKYISETEKEEVNKHLGSILYSQVNYIQDLRSRDMRFPTMWHIDKCRLRPAREASV